jgi:hypothetical protein
LERRLPNIYRMPLKELMECTGIAKTGLRDCMLVSSEADGAIVRSLDDRSPICFGPGSSFTHLESIEICTRREALTWLILNAMQTAAGRQGQPMLRLISQNFPSWILTGFMPMT